MGWSLILYPSMKCLGLRYFFKEVVVALKSINGDKASNPDGTTLVFFPHC